MDNRISQRVILRIVCLLIAATGAWIAWQSPVLGLRAFPFILAQFGGLGGDPLRAAYEAPVAAFRTIGAVLLGVGLFRALEFPGKN